VKKTYEVQYRTTGRGARWSPWAEFGSAEQALKALRREKERDTRLGFETKWRLVEVTREEVS